MLKSGDGTVKDGLFRRSGGVSDLLDPSSGVLTAGASNGLAPTRWSRDFLYDASTSGVAGS